MAVALVSSSPLEQRRHASRWLALLELLPFPALLLWRLSGEVDAFYWMAFAVGLGWVIAGRPVHAIAYALVRSALIIYLAWIVLPVAFGGAIGYAGCEPEENFCRTSTPFAVSIWLLAVVGGALPLLSAALLALRPPLRR